MRSGAPGIESRLDRHLQGMTAMCEASVYLIEGDDLRLLMENVDTIVPEGDGLRLVNIFGEQRFLKARIQSLSLLENRVLLVKAA
jgi:predicted RNA-binding protein